MKLRTSCRGMELFPEDWDILLQSLKVGSGGVQVAWQLHSSISSQKVVILSPIVP